MNFPRRLEELDSIVPLLLIILWKKITKLESFDKIKTIIGKLVNKSSPVTYCQVIKHRFTFDKKTTTNQKLFQ